MGKAKGTTQIQEFTFCSSLVIWDSSGEGCPESRAGFWAGRNKAVWQDSYSKGDKSKGKSESWGKFSGGYHRAVGGPWSKQTIPGDALERDILVLGKKKRNVRVKQ